ncbi:hypothetical protein B0H14DRAFT_2646832 [Mycena olivaceomarginata]|nr:hypothetical protein B0H14DRAFT_2646832 [Mycena olivaceomarginata]
MLCSAGVITRAIAVMPPQSPPSVTTEGNGVMCGPAPSMKSDTRFGLIINSGGIPTSASPKKRASPSKAPTNIPISPKKDGTIQWDTFAARTPDKPVPIYDACSVDFDIKNFKQLPKYDGELDAGMVAMVVFTLGRYSGADSEKLSLNVQAAVAMHDAVPEEDRPAETVIDARMPLPIN